MSDEKVPTICEWCGMEVDPRDYNSTETLDGWMHDECADEWQIDQSDEEREQ